MSVETDKQGPRYPFITLRKAIERARLVWNAARESSVVYNDLVALWNYKPSSSGGTQTLAALRYYGLLLAGGSKDTRKFRLSLEAKNYFLDERPEKHEEAHKQFVLHSKAMLLLWELWKDKPPAEAIARSTLKVDYGYSENNARELLAIYSDNLEFAKLRGSDKISYEQADDKVPHGVYAHPQHEMPTMMPVQPTLPSSGAAAAQIPGGVREDTFNLPEGVVTLRFPETFSNASYEDLNAWLEFQKNRLKRWIADP